MRDRETPEQLGVLSSTIGQRFHRPPVPSAIVCLGSKDPIVFSHVASDVAMPAPTLAEYQQSLGVKLHFLSPYLVAGAIVTVVGCGLSSKVATFLHPRDSRLFLTSLAVCFFCLLGVAGLSDIGTVLRLWRGPMMYGTVSSFAMILEVAVPLSVLAGLLIFARRHPSEPRVD